MPILTDAAALFPPAATPTLCVCVWQILKIVQLCVSLYACLFPLLLLANVPWICNETCGKEMKILIRRVSRKFLRVLLGVILMAQTCGGIALSLSPKNPQKSWQGYQSVLGTHTQTAHTAHTRTPGVRCSTGNLIVCVLAQSNSTLLGIFYSLAPLCVRKQV